MSVSLSWNGLNQGWVQFIKNLQIKFWLTDAFLAINICIKHSGPVCVKQPEVWHQATTQTLSCLVQAWNKTAARAYTLFSTFIVSVHLDYHLLSVFFFFCNDIFGFKDRFSWHNQLLVILIPVKRKHVFV